MTRLWIAAPLALLLALNLACESSGEGGREVLIIQGDDGCTPESIAVTTGEKLKLTGKNETGKTYELEGTNGTALEEILVPEGRTRSVGYTVPDEPGTYEVKCYQPGGVSTIVKLEAGGAGASAGSDGEETEGDVIIVGGNDDPADTSVDVDLTEYKVSPSQSSVSAGNIEFNAANLSDDEVHELAVLRVDGDGGLDVAGEIEDIPAGVNATIKIQLEAGKYQLACLIVPGEAGSEVDHYAEGMHTEFTVD